MLKFRTQKSDNIINYPTPVFGTVIPGILNPIKRKGFYLSLFSLLNVEISLGTH